MAELTPRECAGAARTKARIQVMYKLYLEYYNTCMSEADYETISDDPDFLRLCKWKSEKGKSKQNKLPGWAITLNPPEHPEQLDKLRKVICHILGYKNFIEVHTYAYDQRSRTKGQYYGAHVHMYALDTYTLAKSRVVDRLWNAMRREFKDCLKQSIYVRHSDEGYVDYVKGEKGTEEKLNIYEITKLWHTKYNLKNYYARCTNETQSPLPRKGREIQDVENIA